MKLLVLTNESRSSSAPGQRDALIQLVNQGWIKSVSFVSYKNEQSYSRNFVAILEAVSSKNYDLLFIWSPTSFPESRNHFEQLERGIGNRPVLYWEGDCWAISGIKSFSEQMRWWAAKSDAIFTVAGDPQKSHFEKYCSNVYLIPQTYCHIQFQFGELESPFRTSNKSGIAMIGNQSATLPFLYGVPGSGARFSLAHLLKVSYRDDFHLYGSHWPRWLGATAIPYEEQISTIRKDLFSVNWDHFPKYESFVSDRLPISLLAGRPHITTKHPGKNIYGDQNVGLIEVDTILDAVSACESLLQLDPVELNSMGNAAHRWAKNRLSHRQAGQFMLSKLEMNIPRPKLFPWNIL